MKALPTLATIPFLALALTLCLPAGSQAQDKGGDKPKEKPVIDKNTADKAKAMLDKVVGEVSKAANKTEPKGKELWERTKDNLRLSKDEYIKKAQSGIATMEAEIEVLSESGAGVLSRDYFKMRIESYKLQIDYCKRDLERLKETPSEETFRVKQRGFDRGLGALGDNISLAKDEAGL
ncbi:MAG: hypothetical protein ACAI34_03685 [Verrucomicrobium sp.]|nr:hypothetical protein [Verrucomicrobium sp.]